MSARLDDDFAPMAAEEAARAWNAEIAATSRGSMDVQSSDSRTLDPLERVGERKAQHRHHVTLTWRELRYTVFPNGRDKAAKDVLKGLTGAVVPNHVMALMGPTGSGKTSLLNVLSGRVPAGGVLSGDVQVNRRQRGEDFAQRVAYVMQEELLFPFLSVRETFTLHARLRLPPTVLDAEKTASVDRLISELGLKNVRDAPVGRVEGFPRGLSGGERKRCNIGVEMVRDPSAIFLDEPTSGLDSFQAQNVVGALRDLARNGRSVVCTIHQPRSSIFAMFDQLMLIADGRLVYTGDAHNAVGYFGTMHFKCPPLTNPADFFMDVTSLDFRSGTAEANSRARVRLFAEEAERRGLGAKAVDVATSALLNMREDSIAEFEGPRGDSVETNDAVMNQGAGWLTQFVLLFTRANKSQRRDRGGVGVTVFLDVLYALLLSALYRGVEDDQEGLQNRLGCLFFICLNLAYGAALPSINLFAGEKYIVIRERASGAYTTSAYYVSKLVAELPKLSSKLVFCALVYWIVGFNPDPTRFLNFVLIILAEVLSAQGVGMVLATGMPIGAALALGPAFITVFTLFAGIYLNMDSIPTGAGWVRYIDFIWYAYSALMANEFRDPDAIFACPDGEDATRCLPDGAAVLEMYSFEDIRVAPQIAYQLLLSVGLQLVAFGCLVRSSSKFLPLYIEKADPLRHALCTEDDDKKNGDRGVENVHLQSK
jgi:ABC-type multidrug transport system ATPase subunit